MTPDEQHELDCLRARVAQIAYPCSPHCDGYLRELATRNTTGFLTEPDDAWAERYCTYVGWEPDGSQVSFNSDGMASISFREMAKNHIKAAQQAWFSTRAETAQSSEAPPVSPSEASAGNLPPDEPNYKALYTELKEERERLVRELNGTLLLEEPYLSFAANPTATRDRLMREGNGRLSGDDREFATFLQDAACELTIVNASDRVYRKRAQAAEQALSDLKREVLEKVGPLVRIAHLFGKLPDQDVSVVRSGPRSGNARVEHFRALSTLHDKLSSDVFPESPSGDVSMHAAGEGGGSGAVGHACEHCGGTGVQADQETDSFAPGREP